ncbi:MAG: hypothetical protein ACREV6_15615 [Clostridium sp.]|uniref:hypothetical protein n=1 Tax=Clostridium sp. TaxID=1506 RepID=UPI003D6C8113
MKKNKLFALINFLSIVLTFFIGFEVIKLKNNLINYFILAIINACLMYLCQKLLDNKN